MICWRFVNREPRSIVAMLLPPADVIENDVCLAHGAHEIGGVVIDRLVGAVLDGSTALFVGAGRDHDRQTGELRERGRRGADAAAAPVDEEPLAAPRAGELEHVQKSGQEDLRQRAGLLVGERIRHTHRRAAVDHDLLGIATAGEKRHHTIADVEIRDVVARLDDAAGALEAED